jgi:hypothetical protein
VTLKIGLDKHRGVGVVDISLFLVNGYTLYVSRLEGTRGYLSLQCCGALCRRRQQKKHGGQQCGNVTELFHGFVVFCCYEDTKKSSHKAHGTKKEAANMSRTASVLITVLSVLTVRRE